MFWFSCIFLSVMALLHVISCVREMCKNEEAAKAVINLLFAMCFLAIVIWLGMTK